MPKIVDKESKRKKIARIAMELFAHNGYEKTSIREITSQAGMGKGTFYDYFKDKEDILNEIVNLLFDELAGILVGKISNVEEPITQLKMLLKEAVIMSGDSDQLVLSYMDIWRRAVIQKHESEYINVFQKNLEDSKKAIAAIIEAAKAEGKIRADIDSSMIATVLLALIDGLCIHFMTSKSGMDVDTIIQSFFDALMNGMKT